MFFWTRKGREDYDRGVAAAKLLDFPEKRDARIAFLTSQLADPDITKHERRISALECRLLTLAQYAEETTNRRSLAV